MPKKKKKTAGVARPLDIPTVLYAANTVMQPELLEELEQCQHEVSDLKQQNRTLRSQLEHDDRDKGLIFESMQERVGRNKEYIKVLLQRLAGFQATEANLTESLQNVQQQLNEEKAKNERVSAILSSMENDIKEAKKIITEKTQLQLQNTDLLKENSALRKALQRHQKALQVVNTAEYLQLGSFEAKVPEVKAVGAEGLEGGGGHDGMRGGGTDDASLLWGIEDSMGSGHSASRFSDCIDSSKDDYATSGVASFELLQQDTKPGLVPMVCEAMRCYPSEGAVQRDACFIFMHMAAEGAKVCSLLVKLGALTYVAAAICTFERDAVLLAHAARVFGRVGQHGGEDALEVLRRSGAIALLLRPLSKHRFDSSRRLFYTASKTLQLLVAPHTCEVVPKGRNIYLEVQNGSEVLRLLLLLLDWCALSPRRRHSMSQSSSALGGGGDDEDNRFGHWDYDAKLDVLKFRRRRLTVEERQQRRAELRVSDGTVLGAAHQSQGLKTFREYMEGTNVHKSTAAMLASGVCAALMNTVDAIEVGEVARVVEVDEATRVLVKALRRFQKQPDVVAACCILLRLGLHANEEMRKLQLRFLMSGELALMDLLLEIHKPATYDSAELEVNEQVAAEVSALLAAMGLSTDTATRAAAAKRAAGYASGEFMNESKGFNKPRLASTMRDLVGSEGTLLPEI